MLEPKSVALLTNLSRYNQLEEVIQRGYKVNSHRVTKGSESVPSQG